ncbi:MAG: hypothetical protein E7I76_03455 [Anaerococcus vaginalis]|uniref:hypothetical protein n=1 Tax=Anaerococcus vaginalis TaxID=33037 RepID=UPI002908AB2D|nr:hypothetical protein [Anaerococcus vaginalis]MDU4447044.1 hypothetical protein [Anaerococcus vaginalis]MDU6182681.1 hypothetical protein [Anaerococcus vaginalis]MDU7433462.1 hypothetical protein [Anaerococcus vaginalis]
MKKISKFFLGLASIYYLFISLALFLASLFSLLVNRNYVFAIFDLLGFSNISLEIIKPILFVMLFLLFILITSVDRKIFKSIKFGEYFLFNIFTGFFFIFISIIGHVFFRDKIFIVSYLFNIFLIIGSMIGLREKSKVYYDEENSNEINVDDNKTFEKINEDVKEIEISDENSKENKIEENPQVFVKKDEGNTNQKDIVSNRKEDTENK